MTQRHRNIVKDDAHAHRKSPLKSVQIAGGALQSYQHFFFKMHCYMEHCQFYTTRIRR